MRNALLGLLFLFPLLASASWDSLLDAGSGKSVKFGVVLSGPEPYERHSGDLFAPASNSKLFTAAAVLDALGPSYRYPTELSFRLAGGVASGLRLIGHGDPSWGLSELGDGLTSRVDAIAEALAREGVASYAGEIQVEAGHPAWNEREFPFGWKKSDPSGCGGALAQGFNLNINCASLELSSRNRARWLEPGVPTPVTLNIEAGASTSLRAVLYDRPDGRPAYRIEGSWKNGSAPTRLYLPVWEMKAWIRNLLKEALAKKGIRPVAQNPGGPERTLVFHSPPLSELLKPFVKNSINVMGDTFLKSLALQAGHERELLRNGLAELRAYLLRLGMREEFRLHDGSGLSRESRVSPRALMDFLRALLERPGFTAFYEALPIAGVDGTLRNRMRGGAAAGRLRAKTGTLDGVYSLSGYVPFAGGFVPFVILSQTTKSHSATARAAQDRVGNRLAALLPGRIEAAREPFPYLPEHAGMDDQ